MKAGKRQFNMAHTGPKRNTADIRFQFYLQWHAVDDKNHGRRSLSIIPASKAEAAAAAALLKCEPTQFVTLAIGTREYCEHRRKYYDTLVAQQKQAQREGENT